VCQHRLNTRQRNSVLKLRVATNCTDWETRLNIIRACAQEVIADHEHGHGKAHWEILEELGTHIGLSLEEIRAAEPLPSTQIAWAAWEGLMSNRHWIEGIVANTCAERINVPGYGTGTLSERGWFGLERQRWAKLFGLGDAQLDQGIGGGRFDFQIPKSFPMATTCRPAIFSQMRNEQRSPIQEFVNISPWRPGRRSVGED